MLQKNNQQNTRFSLPRFHDLLLWKPSLKVKNLPKRLMTDISLNKNVQPKTRQLYTKIK